MKLISSTPQSKYKEILIYGISMGSILLLINLLEARFMVYNYQLELFISLIAILFTLLGVWIAFKLIKPKVETLIIEREVLIDHSLKTEINQIEIEKLGISRRELDVLSLMAAGHSNDEIAIKLFISSNTVKTHASNIFTKLDVKRRIQAVEKAKNLKIIG
jgi:two-component system, NarL family, response regulator LiaR